MKTSNKAEAGKGPTNGSLEARSFKDASIDSSSTKMMKTSLRCISNAKRESSLLMTSTRKTWRRTWGSGQIKLSQLTSKTITFQLTRRPSTKVDSIRGASPTRSSRISALDVPWPSLTNYRMEKENSSSDHRREVTTVSRSLGSSGSLTISCTSILLKLTRTREL